MIAYTRGRLERKGGILKTIGGGPGRAQDKHVGVGGSAAPRVCNALVHHIVCLISTLHSEWQVCCRRTRRRSLDMRGESGAWQMDLSCNLRQ